MAKPRFELGLLDSKSNVMTATLLSQMLQTGFEPASTSCAKDLESFSFDHSDTAAILMRKL